MAPWGCSDGELYGSLGCTGGVEGEAMIDLERLGMDSEGTERGLVKMYQEGLYVIAYLGGLA